MNGMYDKPEVEEKTAFEKIISIIGGIGSFLFSSIEGIISAVAIAVILYLFIFTPHEVIGSSMHPTYKDGEYLLANKLTYKVKDFQTGDVVIFKHSETKDYIKRVIGVPGDTVSVQNGHIFLNGKLLDEKDYLENTVITDGGSFLSEGMEVIVPEEKLFVCGDNRPNSSDSRYFGFVPMSDVKGKVWIVYFPVSDLRIIKQPKY